MIRSHEVATAIIYAAGRRDQLVKELAEGKSGQHPADIVAACQVVHELERLFSETRQRELNDRAAGARTE